MGKKDFELMRKMKREEAATRQATKVASEVPAVEGVSFDQWWIDVSRQLKLAPHIKEIVLADFKARGLGLVEPKEKYEVALGQFGYKL